MNGVNFTSIRNIRVTQFANPALPTFPEYTDSKTVALRLECKITEEDFEYFKEVTNKSDWFQKLSPPLKEDDDVQIDILAKRTPKQYELLINKIEIPQNDRSIFGIVTFLCALTKLILDDNRGSKNSIIKHLQVINKALDRIGRRALKNVP